jgi:hypothetical protein
MCVSSTVPWFSWLPVLVALSLLGCVQREGAFSAEQLATLALDQDGVVKLYPDAPGSAFRLGGENPNHVARLSIEKGIRAMPGQDGAVDYWSVSAYPLEYSSGGQGKTARLHMRGTGATQKYTWRTQRGYLSDPLDLGDQEFTAFVRVRGIFDFKRAAVSLKIRGGQHTQRDPALASCTMMTFASRQAPAVSRFGKELDHPDYDYVKLPLHFETSLLDGRWVGLKLVSFRDPHDAEQVINRLYVDDEPFASDGSPHNHFRLLSEYVDRAGKSTGEYDTLVSWGGTLTTLRVDGVEAVDVAILSVRAIGPVAGPAVAR